MIHIPSTDLSSHEPYFNHPINMIHTILTERIQSFIDILITFELETAKSNFYTPTFKRLRA